MTSEKVNHIYNVICNISIIFGIILFFGSTIVFYILSYNFLSSILYVISIIINAIIISAILDIATSWKNAKLQ